VRRGRNSGQTVSTRSVRASALLVLAGLVTAAVAVLMPAGAQAATPAAVTVGATVVGPTPVLGYNIAHGMATSNAADWWRYSGVEAARVFLSASDIEPVDDLSPVGDGVTGRAGFEARRSALRANAASPSAALDGQYVNWSAFTSAYGTVATGNNRFAVSSWFPQLRAMGVDILVNITASPSRFPLTGSTDYGNLWELWQHYYAQAFSLSRDHDVARFSMFNEPNGWTPAITVEDWALRLRVASDAIESAVADMNARYGRSLSAQVFAPNTANGATKYDDVAAGDYWGRTAVTQRSWNIWAEPVTGRRNLQVYNYQKYSMSAADYGTDYDALAAKIAADLPAGEPMFPLALTEFNVRTGSNYDARTETADSPSDYSALGANAVTLAAKGASRLYLFKFGMTDRSGGTYPVAKNGTHYVQNATTGVNNYGGAAGTAEAYRLFVKASGAGRNRLAATSTLGATVAVQATRDPSGGPVWVYLANTGTSAVNVDVDVSALGVADGSLAVTEEVSTTARGAVVRTATVTGGRLAVASMPAQSVWLISVYAGVGTTVTSVDADADAVLGDGTGRTTPGAATNPLVARADGTTAGRKVSVLRFPVPTSWTPDQRVLLSLTASTTAGTTPIAAHVYGLHDDSWSEATVTFASLTSALRQNVGAGNVIANNVVADQGGTTRIVGQVMANSTTATEKLLDVTDFVKGQTDGYASFLLVQDHRWDVKLPELTTGDTQPAGLRVVSREGATRPRLRIHAPGTPPVAVAAPTISPNGGSFSTAQTVTLASSTAGASIRYTTNGSTPTATSGTPYTGPFTVSATSTVKAVASLSGTTSPVSSATFTISTPVTITAEGESLTVVASSGDSRAVKTDTAASGGKSLLYRSNAIGDYVVLRLNVPVAGSYAVSMTAKMMGDRGRFQLAVADAIAGPWVSVDTPKDEYRAAITFGSVGTFTTRATFATSGTKYLRLTVVGKNAASSDYNLNLDRLVLTP